MSTLGILHRDIKLTNIFIGSFCTLFALALRRPFTFQTPRATVKACFSSRYQIPVLTSGWIVGDFGLATSSLAAVDPSDVSLHVIAPEADMTLGTDLHTLRAAAPCDLPSLQRWGRGYTSLLRFSRENADQGITPRRICTVSGYASRSPPPPPIRG